MYSIFRWVFVFFLICLSLSSQFGLWFSSQSASANSEGVAWISVTSLSENFFGKGLEWLLWLSFAITSLQALFILDFCKPWLIISKIITPTMTAWFCIESSVTKVWSTIHKHIIPMIIIAYSGRMSDGFLGGSTLFSLIFCKYSSVIKRLIEKSMPRSDVKAWTPPFTSAKYQVV